MDLSTITPTTFKAYFTRDFPYLPDPIPTNGCGINENDYVSDNDINKAFGEAQIIFNQALFTTDNIITTAYLYLTAHYLCIDLRMAMQGINSAGSNPVASRSVGSVSESYSIPEKFLDNPQLAMLNTTGYGAKYLSLLLPNLVGNIGSVWGGTNP